MRLAKLSEFRSLFFTPDSAPADATLRRAIDSGKLAGLRIGRRYYVDLDEFDRQTGLRAKLNAQMAELKQSPLLKGLI